MKPINPKKQNSASLQLSKLSFAVMVAMGVMNVPTAVQAGPGTICIDGLAPVAPAPAGCASVINTYYANSPKLRKFVDTLPGLTPAGANNYGQYLTVAVKDTLSYPGSDYYELAVVEFSQRMHSDLIKPTTLRGYVQIDRVATNAGAPNTASANVQSLKYPDGSQIYLPKEKGMVGGVWDHTLVKDGLGNPVMVAAIAVDKDHYLGANIIATRGTPTRIKMNNLLPKGRAALDTAGIMNHNGDMFLPVDETLPGAGNSPVPGTTLGTQLTFPQNRVAIHLHGGDTPWISDGTPHQWFTAETDPAIDPMLKRGDRTFNVPDMPYPGEAAQTIFYLNDQTARFMWYHDHAFGLTRQNAYAGNAAAYIVTDPAEDILLGTAVPADMLPLVLQDKTFVPDDIAIQDAKWDQGHWGKPGDLWFPHVYEPAVIKDPAKPATLINNPAARWDWGPTAGGAGTAFIDALLPLPTGDYGQVSTSPEAYMDTAMVNGVAYPTVTVSPKAYRVRLLNGANDRYFNLSLWKAAVSAGTLDPATGKTTAADTEVTMVPEMLPTGFTITNPGSGYVNPQVNIIDAMTPNGLPGYGSGATATATLDPVTGGIASITMINAGSGYANPVVTITDNTPGAPITPAVISVVTSLGREGGIPDPSFAGPNIIQFGNETGLMPKPIVHKPKSISFAYDLVNNMLLDETQGGFYLGNAERGDTVIDFSQYAGQTLILYNDSVAPIPAGDPNYDYYTGDVDHSTAGGAPTTLPGYGPNTRTIMQIKVSGTPTTADPAYDSAGNGGPLATVLPVAYSAIADQHIEAGIVYDGKPTATLLTDWQAAWQLAHPLDSIQVKTIEGGNDVNFGRLIANFGTEKVLTAANKATPIAYIDQATEIVEEGKVQYWHIKNNDADNHPIHFHLFNVQVIARVDQATGTLINPTADEAGWKETVQNWPLQDVIVALKPMTPALPFGLPDSVRLKDPTLNPGDETNTSIDYTAALPGSIIPEAFLQYDLLTGAPIPPIAVTDPVTGAVTNKAGVFNDMQHNGWEYVFHCHILGHEENDLMRPVIFKPIPIISPNAPTAVSVDSINGKVTWADATPINIAGTKGNPANEIGFRVEYAEMINGAPTAFTSVTPTSTSPFVKIPDTNPLNLRSEVPGKINAIANSGVIETNIVALAASKPNTNLVYRVVSVNQFGEAASTSAEFVQLPAAPVLSSALASVTVPGAINLTWQDNSGNETGFRIERAMLTDGVIGTYAQVGTTLVNANALNFTDTTAPLNADYSYRVIAVNSKGDSIVSNAMTVAQAPVAPVAAPVTVTGNTATITWTDNSNNETGFRILRAAPGTAVTAATGWTTVATVAANILTANDTTVIANTDYDYRVVADNGALSNSSNVVTLAQAPAAVTGLAVSTVPAIAARTLTLTWTDNASNEAGFAVEFSTDNGATWLPQGIAPASVAGGLVTYTVTGLTPATPYQFRVGATKANFTTQFTAPVSALTPAELLAPTLAAPISSVVNGLPQVNLNWADTSTGETAYRVERCAGTTAQCLLATANWVSLSTTLPAGTLTYTDSTLATGANYVYRVRALATTAAGVTTLGPIATSAQVTGAVAVTAPTGLTATSPTGVGVTLSWTDASTNETSFQVERAIAPATPGAAPVFAAVGTVARSAALGTATTGLVTFTDATAAAGQNYIYQVRAVRTVAAVAPAVASVSMSAPSNQANITLTIVAPTALTAVQAGANVTLSWQDLSANETAFEVLRTDTTGATVPAVFTVVRSAAQGTSVNTAVTYSDVTAVVGTPYTYAVRAVVTPVVVAPAVAVPGYSAYTTPVNATLVIPAPTGLTTALPVAPATGVVLNWVDNATFETAYQINRAIVTLVNGQVPVGTAYTTIATVARTATQRTATGAASYTDATANTALLPIGQVYSYQVVAVNAPIAPAVGVTSFSLPSNEAHTAAAVAVTGAPTSLTAVTTTGTSVVLSWIDNSATETSYLVSRTDPLGVIVNFTVARTAAQRTSVNTAVTYTDATAVVGKTYTYTVSAVTPAGNLSASITAGLTLNAPTAATATSVATGIQIGWTDQSNNETGFQISRVIIDPLTGMPTGAPTFYAVTSTAAQKTAVGTLITYIDTTALPGVTYSYTVASVSGAAVSAAVSTTPVTITGAAIANPGAPTAVITNATRITLTWTDLSSNETGFVVERLITPAVAGATPPVWTTLATVARTAANSTSVNTAVSYINNLVAPVVQGTYQYRVTAINATGVVAPALPPSSTPVLSNVVDLTVPAAPTALTATTTAGVAGVINLSWTDNATNETGFTVQRATNATFTRGLVSTVVPGANTGNPVNYALSGLTTGTSFYIRVQATNAAGVSTFATVGTVNPTTGVVTPTLVLVP